MSDYRNCMSSKIRSIKDISNEKSNYDRHDYKSENDHYLIKSHTILKSQFRNIYNHKCIYCGITNAVINNELLEADHYFPYSMKDQYSGNINNIENLVLACQSCNRSKSNFLTTHNDKNLFHPDKVDLNKYFYRGSDLQILIRNEYIHDTFVKNFYKQLKLGSYHKRLDFLILKIIEFYKVCNDKDFKIKLYEIKEILMHKRNEII